MPQTETSDKRHRLIGATIGLVLQHGYGSTTVDLICQTAGVTKGSFFHYFATKEAIMRAAMDAWSAGWSGIVAEAEFDQIPDPVARLEKLLDVMSATYMSPQVPVGCVIGMVAQELSMADEGMRQECQRHFEMWLDVTVALLADANATVPSSDFDPDSVARFMISIVQGSMLVAKTMDDRPILASNVEHLRSFLRSLFHIGNNY